MILIFSNDADRSTSSVIDWFLHYNIKFARVNYEDLESFVKTISFEGRGGKIIFNHLGVDISSDEVEAAWFRRVTSNNWNIPSDVDVTVDGVELSDQKHNEIIHKHLQSEFKVVIEYVYEVIQSTCKTLGHYRENRENKLSVLRLAQNVGLSIPKTLIIRPKFEDKDLEEFVYGDSDKDNSFISKALSYSPSLRKTNGYPISSYTEDFNYKDLPLSAKYQLSLIQEKINKLFELRVFYIDGNFYSVAIFSQKNDMTKTDYRKYDYDNPNRTVPYLLPQAVRTKVKLLMDRLNLNTGSIDMIVSCQYEYIFLEVNPVGQFGNVSYHGGYEIEKIIANYLIQ